MNAFRKLTASIMLLSIGVVLWSSCNTGSKKYADTPTSGTVTISVDETLKPIIDSQLRVFHALYKYAHVRVLYKPEAACFADLENDTSKVVISTRSLTAKEKDYFNKIKYFPVETAVANDAIAVVVNKANKDSMLTMYQLKKLLSGEITNWKKLDATSSLGDIQVVFDNKNSSTLRYITDSILKNEKLSDNIFATNNNAEVINYVQKNENAIGIIGVNWAKDKADSVNRFIPSVTIVGLKDEVHLNDEVDYAQPYQAYIQMRYYPLCRKIYCVNRESRAGLGTGFVSFVASDRGQRIILKSGLVPATAPIRIVQLKTTGIQQ